MGDDCKVHWSVPLIRRSHRWRTTCSRFFFSTRFRLNRSCQGRIQL
jgi:hypothetical protein